MSANENAILLCQHLTRAGHRCHMPLSAGHPSLCTHHLRVAKREAARYAETTRLNADHLSFDNSAGDTQLDASRLNRETVANELLAGAENLSTPASVNLFLGNLLKQVAHDRISRKNAIAMAYISQLLLNSISVMQREARDLQLPKTKSQSASLSTCPAPDATFHPTTTMTTMTPTTAPGATKTSPEKRTNPAVTIAETIRTNMKTRRKLSVPPRLLKFVPLILTFRILLRTAPPTNLQIHTSHPPSLPRHRKPRIPVPTPSSTPPTTRLLLVHDHPYFAGVPALAADFRLSAAIATTVPLAACSIATHINGHELSCAPV
jgi:hypothetical protein